MPARRGRPPKPEPRRNNICAKLSDAEFAAVEAARGNLDRSEWARRVLLAAAQRQRPPESHTDRQADAARQNLAALDSDCPHPPARVLKGLCGACGTNVGQAAQDRRENGEQ